MSVTAKDGEWLTAALMSTDRGAECKETEEGTFDFVISPPPLAPIFEWIEGFVEQNRVS